MCIKPGDGHVITGCFVVVAFAGVSIVHVLRLLKRKPLYELTPEGFRPARGGTAPWRDIEDVGVGTVGSRGTGAGRLVRPTGVVGIRLSDYQAYARSLPENLPGWRRFDTWMAARSMPPVPPFGGLTVHQRDLVALMAWNRERTGGLDMSWLQRFMPAPPDMIVSYKAKF